MRIAAYFAPMRGLVHATGVTKHAIGMINAMTQRSELRVRWLTHKDEFSAYAGHLPHRLRGLGVLSLPGSETVTRRLQVISAIRPVDRWLDGSDWIYCPKETPLAVRDTRLAITVHDVRTSETALPFMPAARWRTRLGWRITMGRILQRAHLIATVSEFTKRRIIELHDVRDPDRIVVVGNGVEEVYFEPPQSSDADERVLAKHSVKAGRFLVAVGGLNFRKGGDALLTVGERLRARGDDAMILVCGLSHDDDLLKRFHRLRDDDPIFPLRLAGYVPSNELAALYRHAIALLFPSRYEGFGIPVLEAMAAGTPVICANGTGIPEAAGDAGLLISPGLNVDEVVAAIDRASDPNTRDSCVRAGQIRARGFTWQHCAQRLLDAMKAAN